MPPTFEASRRDLLEHSFTSPAFRDEAARRRRPGPLSAAWTLPARPGRDRHDVRARHRRRHGRAPGRGVRARRRPRPRPASCSPPASSPARRPSCSPSAPAAPTSPRSRRRPRPTATRWRLNGFKWFASNANGSGVRRAGQARWARPTASAASPPFLVLRDRRDGTRNGIRIRRLKDKLGTKAVASAEVEFDDAEAFLLAPGRGRRRRRREGPRRRARHGPDDGDDQRRPPRHRHDGPRLRPAGARRVALLRPGPRGVRQPSSSSTR